jgi:CheY-like chemotaxis protein
MTATTTTTPTDRNPRALLLASDPAAATVLRETLEGRGFDVLQAPDGTTGTALLLDALLDLDVVVTDLDLPGRDAWSLVHLVRGPGGEHDLAIVVLAPRAEPRAWARLAALGADAVTGGAAAPGATADAALAAIARRRGRTVQPPLAVPAGGGLLALPLRTFAHRRALTVRTTLTA